MEVQPFDKLNSTFRGRVIVLLKHISAFRKLLIALVVALLGWTTAGVVAMLFHSSFGLQEAANQLTYPMLGLLLALGGTMAIRILDVRFTPTRFESLSVLYKFGLAKLTHDSIIYRFTGFEYIKRYVRMVPQELFEFPPPEENNSLLKESTFLNCKAFSNTSYNDEFKSKHARNGSHQRRNPHTIMLVHDRSKFMKEGVSTPKGYVGFTHLIPVNEASYNRYINGEIADKTFNAGYVCRESKEAWAIILFSLGVYGYRVKELAQGKSLSWYDKILERIGANYDERSVIYESEYDLWMGCVYHLQILFDNQCFAQENVRLVAQSLNSRLIAVLTLIGFKRLPNLSADGEPLFEMIITADKVKMLAKKSRPENS